MQNSENSAQSKPVPLDCTLGLPPCKLCGAAARSGDGFLPLESITYAWCSNSNCPNNSELIDIDDWNTEQP